MVQEFWDMRSNNLVAAFETEREAFTVLHDIMREQGERAFEYLMLIEDNVDTDESRVVAMGLELADLVRSAA
jgi:hypothetical protein